MQRCVRVGVVTPQLGLSDRSEGSHVEEEITAAVKSARTPLPQSLGRERLAPVTGHRDYTEQGSWRSQAGVCSLKPAYLSLSLSL